MLRKGFEECFRVLKPEGTLIFKWNEDEVAVTEILKLTPEQPLIGNRYGKHFKSHWIVFLKPKSLRLGVSAVKTEPKRLKVGSFGLTDGVRAGLVPGTY